MDLSYQALLVAIVAVALGVRRVVAVAWSSVVVGALMAALIGAVVLAQDPFHAMRHLAWLLFVYVPAYCVFTALWVRGRDRVLSLSCLVVALLLIAIAVDAFLIEPHSLDVTHYEINSSKLKTPLRIVVISDLQTDHIGDYERDAIERARGLAPDLVLLPGDYLQVDSQAAYTREASKLRQLLGQLKPKLGLWAVEGNVEPVHGWTDLFHGTAVQTFAQTETRAISEQVTITGLTLSDSFNTDLEVDQEPSFHIALGHAPDFALGTINADLLVAGHTHGGQVRLPIIGPLLTLSAVPRKWATGRTELPGPRTLIVSRGIGMERGYAPRLRFLCRPELMVIDVKPNGR